MSFKLAPTPLIGQTTRITVLWGPVATADGHAGQLELPGTFASVVQTNGPVTLTPLCELPVVFRPEVVGFYSFMCGDFLRPEVSHSSKHGTSTWSVPATGLGAVNVIVVEQKDLPAWFSAHANPQTSSPGAPATRMTHGLGLGLSIAIYVSGGVVVTAQIVVPVSASIQAQYVAQSGGLRGAVASLVGMDSTAIEAAMDPKTGAIPIALAAALANASPSIPGVDSTVAGLVVSGGWVAG